MSLGENDMPCRCKMLERRPLQTVFDREVTELTADDIRMKKYVRISKGPIVISDI